MLATCRALSLLAVLPLGAALSAQGQAAALRAAVAGIERAIEQEHVLGAVLLVTQGDRVLVHEALGHRDVARTRAMRKDTLFRMASNTKA
ncbi:MAG: serine hydrolase, partial [Planctomycetota bacterium]